jgi:allantoinase
MTRSNSVLRGRRVVTPEGPRPASVHIADGRIVARRRLRRRPRRRPLVDADDAGALLMPGVVDTHVHINEPGRTEWEGFVTATRAAAAGGITTLVDMPLNSIPPTTTVAALGAKLAGRRRGSCMGRRGLLGRRRARQHAASCADGSTPGALGFKCFLVESGVEEFGFVTEGDRAAPGARARPHRHAALLVHAELPGPDRGRARRELARRPTRAATATYLRSRPPAAEDEAIACSPLCRDTGARVHVVHLSSAAR